SPIVSVDWMYKHINHPNLIVIDATMTKVSGCDDSDSNDTSVIKNARFLDIKNEFSDTIAPFPNTLLSSKKFEEKAQAIGINNNSCVVVYDRYGYYSCARVWWMLKTMGFYNCAILDGGLPDWIEAKYPTQKEHLSVFKKGNFTASYTTGLIHNHSKVLKSLDDDSVLVLDARSRDRFLGTQPEPREGLRSGHIPNSKSLPYTSLLNGTKLKSSKELNTLFSDYQSKELIFTCGSGVTACILALGAEIVGIKNKSVYDGSWTEWGSLSELPIEK
ncbi:MAG: sulfurtransferase, partial [Urechidicola sp.]|nr:sulfurtransferase [Urechidicola sp.]